MAGYIVVLDSSSCVVSAGDNSHMSECTHRGDMLLHADLSLPIFLPHMNSPTLPTHTHSVKCQHAGVCFIEQCDSHSSLLDQMPESLCTLPTFFFKIVLQK